MAVKIKLPFCFSQLSPVEVNRLKETVRTKSTPENDFSKGNMLKC